MNSKWYKHLNVVLKWNNQIHYDNSLIVTRGTRQGSLLSPMFFNVYIKDLMCTLQSCSEGIIVGDRFVNSFVYADDISIFSSTVCGLQNLVNICSDYAKAWRLVFGCAKIKFVQEPRWFLGNNMIDNVTNLDILGVTFSSTNGVSQHTDIRINKGMKAFYSMKPHGLCYPGLNSFSKAALYKSMCQPVLTYGCDAL